MQVIAQLKGLDEERFTIIYESLAEGGYGPLDGEVARALKFRPHTVRKLPMQQRARRARMILLNAGNAELCYELFGGYLMKHRKELVTSFLDETGVPHEEGMIQNVEDAKPEGAKVNDAVAKLDAEFDPGDVTLYLSLCAEQWPNVPEIEAAWKLRPDAPA
jgi:hypothetical protein